MSNIINFIKYSVIIQTVILVLVCIIVLTFYLENTSLENTQSSVNYMLNSSNTYIWPAPGFSGISSYFGRRNSPTAGASSYHKGIDILAYQNSNVCSIGDGIITFSGFSASGGYMVKIQHNNGYISSYCHLSEKLFVKKGDKVVKGEVIGTVGPKYLSNGKLNGATTGVHLHFALQIKNDYVDPLKYIKP